MSKRRSRRTRHKHADEYTPSEDPLAALPAPDEAASTMDHYDLQQTFSALNTKIIQLAQKIERHRYTGSEEDDSTSKVSTRCHLVCQALQGDAKLACLRDCTRPMVTVESVDKMEPEFPIDVQRLRSDTDLMQNFERHQRAPATIQASDAEASKIADMYAMPIATAALPEEAWSRSMEVISADEFRPQRERLVTNWQNRATNYSTEARDELARKLNRHDASGEIIKTAKQLESNRI